MYQTPFQNLLYEILEPSNHAHQSKLLGLKLTEKFYLLAAKQAEQVCPKAMILKDK
jgi:hypothetical protein